MKKISKNWLQLAYVKYFISYFVRWHYSACTCAYFYLQPKHRSFLNPKNIQSGISYNKSLMTFITIDLPGI